MNLLFKRNHSLLFILFLYFSLEKVIKSGDSISHSEYKGEGIKDKLVIQQINWFREFIDNLSDAFADAKELQNFFKLNLDNETIFVFTPKNEVIEMKSGSTILDFAFKIHTDIGLHCVGGLLTVPNTETGNNENDNKNVNSNPDSGKIKYKKIIKPLDLNEGKGNFYMKPNGVFYITENNTAGITESSDYLQQNSKNIKYATQSGNHREAGMVVWQGHLPLR